MAAATRELNKPKMIIKKGQEEAVVLSPVEQFIALFLEIDRNKDGVVTRDELVDYYIKHGLNKSRVDEWMSRFDLDADNRITIEEFAKGLGLNLDELKAERTQRAEQAANKVTECKVEDIDILATVMTVAKQEEVANKFKQLVQDVKENEDRMGEVADKLKAFLDTEYGPIWQCVILTGSYWMKFSHEPFMSIQFRYKDKFVCLAWRVHRE